MSNYYAKELSKNKFLNEARGIYRQVGEKSIVGWPAIVALDVPRISLRAQLCFLGSVETASGLWIVHQDPIDPYREIAQKVGTPISGIIALNPAAHSLEGFRRSFSVQIEPFVMSFLGRHFSSLINVLAYPDKQVRFAMGNLFTKDIAS